MTELGDTNRYNYATEGLKIPFYNPFTSNEKKIVFEDQRTNDHVVAL